MSKQDGGSAFPEVVTDWTGSHGDYKHDTYSTGGMSLRDYFAAKALQGMLCNGFVPLDYDSSNRDYVGVAYALADDMLAERTKATGE